MKYKSILFTLLMCVCVQALSLNLQEFKHSSFIYAQGNDYYQFEDDVMIEQHPEILRVNHNMNAELYHSIVDDINAILANHKELNQAKYGIAVFSTKLNDWIFSKNHKQLLVPASNTKLVTTFANFDLLGANYMVETPVITDGTIENGVLNGNVYIVGGGDALLTISDIEVIADAIQRLGITRINGNIYGDNSFFDKVSNRFLYSGDKDEVQPTAPITALAIERNVVNVIVTSGAIAGRPVNVQTRPASSAFTFSNSAVVRGAAQTKKSMLDSAFWNNDLSDDLADYANNFSSHTNNFSNNTNDLLSVPDDLLDDYTNLAGDSRLQISQNRNTKKAPARRPANPITITTSLQNGRQTFTVQGSLPPNRTFSYRHFIQNPALVVAGVLRDRLIAGGITVNGEIGEKEISVSSGISFTDLFVFKRDINQSIQIANKQSDNFVSEMLFKLNGAINRESANVTKNAKTTLLQALKNNNIDATGFTFNDGSGLSRRNLISAEGLVNILLQARNRNFRNNFENSLSIAGVDGTLANRMASSPVRNNLKAKTGTHKNVSSLAGVLETRSGDTLYFAYIFNGGSVGLYKRLENQISIKLSEY